MQAMRKVTLPSGAILEIGEAPFATAKALWQALMREMKLVAISQKGEVSEMLKNAFCAGFSSPEVEACLWECMRRCLYNGLKIDDGTFEPTKARGDYIKVCVEVAKDNVSPFAKSLYADYKTFMGMTESIRP